MVSTTSEKVESVANLKVILGGDDTLDARLAKDVLLSIIEVIDCSTNEVEPDSFARVEIVSVDRGSFIISFKALVDALPLLDAAGGVATAVIGLMLGVFKFVKWLRGRKIDKIEADGDKAKISVEGDVFIIDKPIINVMTRDTAAQSISKLFTSLDESERNYLRLESDKDEVTIAKSEYSTLSRQEALIEELFIETTTSSLLLYVIKPDLLGSSKWTFAIPFGNRIDASIQDKSFIDRVQSGQIAFAAGDSIMAKVEARYQLDDQGLPVPKSTRHTILEVKEFFNKTDSNIEKDQISFFDE